MRHARRLSLALLAVIVVAGCTTAEAGWTYAPAPSGTPAPSGAAPSGAASAGPSAPGASGSPAASSSTDLVLISALGIKYEQAAVTVPASVPFQIQFDNKDAGTPHNIAIHQGGPTGPELFKGEIFNGVGTRVYSISALDPGGYSFVCTVHPTMVGTLTSQ